jgi:hypothetical protein
VIVIRCRCKVSRLKSILDSAPCPILHPQTKGIRRRKVFITKFILESWKWKTVGGDIYDPRVGGKRSMREIIVRHVGVSGLFENMEEISELIPDPGQRLTGTKEENLYKFNPSL